MVSIPTNVSSVQLNFAVSASCTTTGVQLLSAKQKFFFHIKTVSVTLEGHAVPSLFY